MKTHRWIILAAGIAFALPAQAQDRAPERAPDSGSLGILAPDPIDSGPEGIRAQGGTELILYRFPGVRDNTGATNTGVATSFHCTNFSGVTETIRFVLRDQDSTVMANATFDLPHLQTVTASTHGTAAFLEDLFLSPGFSIGQGTMAIAATTTSIICTAMIVDASTASPVGVSLRGVRFNPAPGSQE